MSRTRTVTPQQWAILERLVMSGLSARKAAQQLNVNATAVETHAARNGWTKKRREVQQALALATISPDGSPSGMAHISENLKAMLASDVRKTVETLLVVKQSKAMREIQARANVQAKVAETAARIFGWGPATAPTVLNLSLLTTRPVEEVDGPQDDSPAIEAQVEPGSAEEQPGSDDQGNPA